jgi:hypothetical protein
MLKKIQALVQSRSHLALATAGPDARPHVSLMAYAAAPDASEFWLATLADTRKYRNLLANPRASLLIDDRGAAQGGPDGGPSLALTVEAALLPFATVADRDVARGILLKKHAKLSGFLAGEGVELLRLASLRFQLLSGLTEVFLLEAEKTLDASG